MVKCDGIVALDTFKYTGTELHDLTHSGTASYSPGTLAYPGNLPPGSDAYKPVYESNAGCGSNSDYSVRWSVQRAALAAQPEVTTARRPGAVISRGEPVVVVTDRYGTVWEQRHDRGQGWRGFVNLGMPPGTVAAGAPVASTGLAGTGPLEVFVVGAPQTGMDGSTTGQNVFALQEGGDGSPSWVDDRQGPPGDQAAPGASAVAAVGGATIVFVVSDRASCGSGSSPTGGPGGSRLAHRRARSSSRAGCPRSSTRRARPGCLPSAGTTTSISSLRAWARPGATWALRLLAHPPVPRRSVPPGASSVGWCSAVTGTCTDSGRARATGSAGTTTAPHPAPQTAWCSSGWVPATPASSPARRYVGALVVSDSGELSELYRTGDGAWNWVSIGPPMGRRNPRVAVSDPSYVGVAMGYRGGFMNGLDGHLYEASASGSGHDWTWTDHGA